MRSGTLEEILLREPVNRLASIVTSQKGCLSYQGLLPSHLVEAHKRMVKSRKALLEKMGSPNKTQRKNYVHRYLARKDSHKSGMIKDPLVAKYIYEFIETGQALKRIENKLAEVRKLRKSQE
jgi:hypothetical protein